MKCPLCYKEQEVFLDTNPETYRICIRCQHPWFAPLPENVDEIRLQIANQVIK